VGMDKGEGNVRDSFQDSPRLRRWCSDQEKAVNSRWGRSSSGAVLELKEGKRRAVVGVVEDGGGTHFL
jgi:hypothetical protein